MKSNGKRIWLLGEILAAVVSYALVVSSANAAPVYTGTYVDMYLKGNTFPTNLSEEMVFLDMDTSDTITGHVGSQTDARLVTFSSSLDTLIAANGYATIKAVDGYINELTITAPGYYFEDLIFSVNLAAAPPNTNSNNQLRITATSTGGGDIYTGMGTESDWVPGDNRILILSKGGNLMQSVTLESPYGFSYAAGIDQLKQVEISGLRPVPLPAAVWLFGSGVLGIAAIGRRKRATQTD